METRQLRYSVWQDLGHGVASVLTLRRVTHCALWSYWGKQAEGQRSRGEKSRGAEKKEDAGTRGHADAGKFPVHSKSPHGDLTRSSAFLEPRVLVSASPHLRVRSEATAPLHLRTPYYLHHLMIMPRLISLAL
ncbi:MAG: hypothetical protein BRC43_10785 [Cyanobacteria bacterium QS_3_48_167]|nr:MAG: hypothetical protein BRC43_10785 [Cyanobacteria bacterium QS_3_48_167]